MQKEIQCKDIPTLPVLKFLDEMNGTWATWCRGFKNSVCDAMPRRTPDKLVLAKMRVLIRDGLVAGCPCGCRGDFALTDKGHALLAS